MARWDTLLTTATVLASVAIVHAAGTPGSTARTPMPCVWSMETARFMVHTLTSSVGIALQ